MDSSKCYKYRYITLHCSFILQFLLQLLVIINKIYDIYMEIYMCSLKISKRITWQLIYQYICIERISIWYKYVTGHYTGSQWRIWRRKSCTSPVDFFFHFHAVFGKNYGGSGVRWCTSPQSAFSFSCQIIGQCLLWGWRPGSGRSWIYHHITNIFSVFSI